MMVEITNCINCGTPVEVTSKFKNVCLQCDKEGFE